MLETLGRLTCRGRHAVLIATVVLAVAAGAWGAGIFPELSTSGYADPDTEAAQTSRILERELGRHDSVDAVAIYHDPSGTRTVDDPAFANAVPETLNALPSAQVASVTSYWTPGLAAADRTALVSHDRHATYVAFTMVGDTEQERLAAYEAILDDLEAPGLEVTMGGGLTSLHQLQELATGGLARSQVIAMPILLVLLVLIFRGLIAGMAPVALGVISILGSMALLRALTAVTDISIFALEVSILLGLGLAIDYGLFIVTRFRDELAHRGNVATALPATLATAGRTVAFSGLTVMVALSGLLLFPQPASRSFGLGGITVVLFNIVTAVVVLPALLAVLGHRINALRIPWPRRTVTGTVAARAGVWARLAQAIMRRPVPWLVSACAALLLAIVPLASIQLGQTNHRYLPADSDSEISAAMLRQDFPAGGPAANPIDVAVVGTPTDAGLDDYVRRLAAPDGATGAEVHRAGEGVTHVTVGFTGEVDDPVNLQLVHDLRAQAWPAGVEEVLVGGDGTPALTVDNTESTLQALPGVLLFVTTVTLVVLFLAFGSLVLPVKAVLVTFASLAASFGILTWGMQEGGFAGVLGFEPVGTTDIWNYGIIFAIAFGLVTDYELFIVSRAREEYLATGDNTRAVTVGLQRTGGIITSAALLMIVVLAAMGTTASSVVIMTIGIGLAIAVLIDATLIRATLVPASMRLFGDANWWLPGPLRRLHDRFGLSESAAPPPPRTPADETDRLTMTR